tara:strand:+ start:115 stop:306 length:192 start_codon:yes stop_codon:yes gene_type:complete
MSRIIKINVSTGWANGDYDEELELPDGWDDWTEEERDEFLNGCATELLHNSCECAAWVEEDEE